MRPFMEKIICPYQNVFVPKRQISDSIALARELLHTMKSKKCKTSYMALKIDLEKAYDKLERNFIENALVKCNSPNQLITWIMTSLKSVNFSLLIMGTLRRSGNRKWEYAKETLYHLISSLYV